jgi:hypothetical protein
MSEIRLEESNLDIEGRKGSKNPQLDVDNDYYVCNKPTYCCWYEKHTDKIPLKIL